MDKPPIDYALKKIKELKESGEWYRPQKRKGRGGAKKPPMTTFLFIRLTKEQKQALKEMAQKNGYKKMSTYARKILEEIING